MVLLVDAGGFPPITRSWIRACSACVSVLKESTFLGAADKAEIYLMCVMHKCAQPSIQVSPG